jgi:hypothetical protein
LGKRFPQACLTENWATSQYEILHDEMLPLDV